MPTTTVSTAPAIDAASWSQQRNGRRGGQQVGNSAVDVFDPQRLRQARASAGLTQREVAIKLLEAARAARGEDPQQLPADAWARAVETERVRVNTYEQGTHTPRAGMLQLLAKAVGVDAFDLFRADTPRTLATLRSRLGLTQADVAATLSVGRAYYSRVEQGRAALHDPADLQALADALDVDLAEVRRLATAPAPA